jgi:hypothetical protein
MCDTRMIVTDGFDLDSEYKPLTVAKLFGPLIRLQAALPGQRVVRVIEHKPVKAVIGTFDRQRDNCDQDDQDDHHFPSRQPLEHGAIAP